MWIEKSHYFNSWCSEAFFSICDQKFVSILKETHGFPPRECFASKITEQTEISESDHAWAVYVYDLFSCESLYDYLQVYNHIGM